MHAEIEKLGGDVDVDEKMDDDEPAMETEDVVEDDGFTVPQYESGEDYENQSELKMKAADSKNAGNLEDALESYNGAVTAAPPSALLLSNRAIVLEKLGHYKAAELDCKLALEQNPDSAKALKTRGKLRFEHLNDWEGALG
ncbi:MAG: tetratricopeptide (TPR) repeat protein [Bacillariaceae sp.]